MSFVPMIDESACLAHGDCAELVPDVFAVDDVARVVGTAPLERLLEAARSCPASAIVIVEEDSGEQVYP